MHKIKLRDIPKNTIKTIDKSIIVSERLKDNINTKIKENNDDSIYDYGSNKIYYVTNHTGDEVVHIFNQNGIKSVGNTRKNFIKIKAHIKNIKTKIKTKRTLETSIKTIKKSEKVAKETVKKSRKAAKLAKDATKKTVKTIKLAIKATVTTIKAIILGTKALIDLLLAFGWIAVVIIIAFCLIAFLLNSIFGIFYSNEQVSPDSIIMRDVIVESNKEFSDKIQTIQQENPHDAYIIDGNMASWKDILSIYAIKISSENKDVMLIDEEKKEILKEIFWDFNIITYEIKKEKYVNNTFENNNIIDNDTLQEKQVLHININSQSKETIYLKYGFNEQQIEQVNELSSDKYLSLWNNVIYGSYGQNNELSNWKQNNSEWSSIKIGNTNYSIGDIGCLTTSIAILIKKSNVLTDNIYPFNPGTFVLALNNNNGFDSKGRLYYSSISKIIPEFQFQGHKVLRGKTKQEKFKELKEYYEAGYYIAVEVRGATSGKQHWVAIDNITNDILMLDPASNETKMWEKYDWNDTSQFVYFKVDS